MRGESLSRSDMSETLRAHVSINVHKWMHASIYEVNKWMHVSICGDGFGWEACPGPKPSKNL